jgi:hypothetical protein
MQDTQLSFGVKLEAKNKEMLLKQKYIRQFYRLAVVFLLFQKSLMPEDTTGVVAESEDEEPDFSRIRCPLCQWQPKTSSRWRCSNNRRPENFFNGCGAVWNTFTTRGLCPNCGHQWRWTACLSCHDWSLHEDWYVKETD